MANEIKAGDTLYYAPDDQRWNKPRLVKVAKVGRVWLTTEGRMRINRETFRVEGIGSYGYCYRSEHDYHQELRRQRMLQKIHERTISYRRNDLTLEQAEQIAAILGLEDDQ